MARFGFSPNQSPPASSRSDLEAVKNTGQLLGAIITGSGVGQVNETINKSGPLFQFWILKNTVFLMLWSSGKGNI